MLRNEHGSTLAALTSLLIIASCSASDVIEPPSGQATLSVTADVSATSVATVVVEVMGPGIATPLVFNLAITAGVATGTITIPAGSNRVITMRAFDANGTQTHQGSVTMNIVAGTNPTVSLVLTPLTGDVPITVTLGSITVTVSPSTASVAVGSTVPLAATVTGPTGAPLAGPVSWATGNPGVASVTSTSTPDFRTAQVTGVVAGQTVIVATFGGVAGSSTVTVTGP